MSQLAVLNTRLDRLHPWGILLLRLVVGIVFLVHGLQKIFILEVGNVAGFFGSLSIPQPFVMAIVVTALEVLGGLALILGAFTRLAAIPLAVIMLVAILTAHLPNGFFVSPNGGYEFALTLLVANVALVTLGSGALALDDVLMKRGEKSASQEGAPA